MQKLLPRFSIFIFFSIILLFTFPHPINLITADLGRHLKNGEVFFRQHKIVDTNYYSYTQTDFPSINHHWAAGVIYFFIFSKMGGFLGLAIFNFSICLLTFWLALNFCFKVNNFFLISLCGLMSVPLISYRHEIRPEMFSYLLMTLFLKTLYSLREEWKVSKIVLLFLMEIFWVNLHIYFILGVFLVIIFLIEAAVRKESLTPWGILLFVVLAATFFNPWQINGAFTPFGIFHNYGYMLAENQSLVFMQRRFLSQSQYFSVEIILLLIVVSFIAIFLKRISWGNLFIPVLILLMFSLLSLKALRCMALLGWGWFMFGPQLLILLNDILGKRIFLKRFIFVILITATIFLGFRSISLEGTIKTRFQLLPQINQSAEIFRKLNIQGPIFNNYDIGGYLIYHLFPQEKVFVDNRPESYSKDFFKKIYVPMQEDENIWQQQLQQYQFNVIYFFRLDITPWAQPFLIRRLQDQEWAPIYVDNFVLILLRRNSQNANIISKYQLPLSMFAVSSNH